MCSAASRSMSRLPRGIGRPPVARSRALCRRAASVQVRPLLFEFARLFSLFAKPHQLLGVRIEIEQVAAVRTVGQQLRVALVHPKHRIGVGLGVETVPLLFQAAEMGQAASAQRLRLLHVDRALQNLGDELPLQRIPDPFIPFGKKHLTRMMNQLPAAFSRFDPDRQRCGRLLYRTDRFRTGNRGVP